MALTKKTNN